MQGDKLATEPWQSTNDPDFDDSILQELNVPGSEPIDKVLIKTPINKQVVNTPSVSVQQKINTNSFK